MEKIKVLFQRASAENRKTGEVAEVVFQHFSSTFNFRDPKNRECLRAINEYRQKKFGDLKPAGEHDIKQFGGKEVFELVVDGADGTSFERGHYRAFTYEKWNPKNFSPVDKRKWKRLNEDESDVMKDVTSRLTKAFGSTIQELCPVDYEKVVAKVATAGK